MPDEIPKQPDDSTRYADPLPTDPPHQVRQVLAGLLALGIGVYDAWWKGQEHQGFDISFDTVLLMTGLYLISGVRGIAPVTNGKPAPPVTQPK